MSWSLPYFNSFIRTDKMVFNYLTAKKDSRMWIGGIEAILSLAYIRFRPGAKFRLQKGFRITNDHSHPVQLGDYKFNFQGLKRSFMGGSSVDLLNFKTPIFYSYLILDKMKPENRHILLKLALESINNLIETYSKDILAMEALNHIKLILEILLEVSGHTVITTKLPSSHTYIPPVTKRVTKQIRKKILKSNQKAEQSLSPFTLYDESDNQSGCNSDSESQSESSSYEYEYEDVSEEMEVEPAQNHYIPATTVVSTDTAPLPSEEEKNRKLTDIEKYLSINRSYLDSPLTKKNIALWDDDIDILNKIADLYRKAHTACLEGRNYEPHLNVVRDYMEEIRYKLEEYLMEIPKGNV